MTVVFHSFDVFDVLSFWFYHFIVVFEFPSEFCILVIYHFSIKLRWFTKSGIWQLLSIRLMCLMFWAFGFAILLGSSIGVRYFVIYFFLNQI